MEGPTSTRSICRRRGVWSLIVLGVMVLVPAALPAQVPLWQRGAGGGARATIQWPIRAEVGSSEGCLSCHDGSIGPSINGHGGAMGFGSSHPIGVSMMQAYLKKPGRYVHPLVLDPAVKLFDGKVECSSCHTTSSETEVGSGRSHPAEAGNRAMLVMSNARSALCLSCHKM